jgi:2-polyprenyl-3-methyl-5-hydroxy-6-metoxy-1,4-benzoquinol methylase
VNPQEEISLDRRGRSKLDPRDLLRRPVVYKIFQSVVGANASRRMFFEEYIAPLAGSRVLEVGCGPGANCRWVPTTVDYVGTDISPEYVGHAQHAYGARAEFHTCAIGELATLNLGKFAAVIALNLLHHLSDVQVFDLCDEVTELLDEGGSLITADPCLTVEQSKLERKITLLDRGNFVRSPERYADLIGQRFDHTAVRVGPGHARIPSTGTTMIAWNGSLTSSTIAAARADA